MTRVRTMTEAGRWLDRVGFAMLFPVRGVRLPSLWEAMGRRPTSGPTWDDDMARLWGWKDQLPRRRRAWYGKLFRGKGTLIALRLLPCFCAAAGTPWDLEAAEALYSRGLLSADARKIAGLLAREGPLPTLALRYGAGFAGPRGNARFKRAVEELQRRLLVTHFGTQEEEGAAWPSNVYELAPRAFPALAERAGNITAEEGRREIERAYAVVAPEAGPRQVRALLAQVIR